MRKLRSRSLFITIIFFCLNINAKSIYVSKNGNNKNDGGKNAPFASIQKAIENTNQGDTCILNAGIYREQINISNSKNITIRAMDKQKVLITGTNLVTGWEKYSGNIYRAKISGIESEFSQLFYNGKRMSIARYPNQTTTNMFGLDEKSGYAPLEVKTGGEVVFDSPLPGNNNDWKGCYFRAISAKGGGTNPTGKVLTSSGKNINCQIISSCWEIDSETGKSSWKVIGKGVGYLLGLKALDNPGEWYYKDNYVYFWKPEGTLPTDTEVALQKRDYTLIAENCKNIRIENLNFKGTNIKLEDCNNCLIENCSFVWLKGWFTKKSYSTSLTDYGGIYIKGENNIVKNSYFYGSWGNLLNFDTGKDCVVDNCYFKNNGWYAIFTSSIQNSCYNLTVKNSTLGNTGRFVIRSDTKFNCLHNNIYDGTKITQDCGCIVTTSGGTEPIDLDNSEFAYNIIHDCSTNPGWRLTGSAMCSAFYLEGGINYTVHHNCIYNINTTRNDGDHEGVAFYLGPGKSNTKNVYYYNNTFWKIDWGFKIWYKNGVTFNNINIKNNLFDSKTNFDFGDPSVQNKLNLKNNVIVSDSSIFTDYENKGFTLTSKATKLIDKGMDLEGITEGYSGDKPDIGCYEYENTKWECGWNLDPYKYAGFLDSNNWNGFYYSNKGPVKRESNIFIQKNNSIYIKYPESFSWSIYDTKGQEICNGFETKKSKTICLKRLPKGIFLFKIKSLNKVIKFIKF